MFVTASVNVREAIPTGGQYYGDKTTKVDLPGRPDPRQERHLLRDQGDRQVAEEIAHLQAAGNVAVQLCAAARRGQPRGRRHHDGRDDEHHHRALRAAGAAGLPAAGLRRSTRVRPPPTASRARHPARPRPSWHRRPRSPSATAERPSPARPIVVAPRGRRPPSQGPGRLRVGPRRGAGRVEDPRRRAGRGDPPGRPGPRPLRGVLR